jgi:hypothetical protein
VGVAAGEDTSLASEAGKVDGCKERGLGFISSTTLRIKPERPPPDISDKAGSITCLIAGFGLLVEMFLPCPLADAMRAAGVGIGCGEDCAGTWRGRGEAEGPGEREGSGGRLVRGEVFCDVLEGCGLLTRRPRFEVGLERDGEWTWEVGVTIGGGGSAGP